MRHWFSNIIDDFLEKQIMIEHLLCLQTAIYRIIQITSTQNGANKSKERSCLSVTEEFARLLDVTSQGKHRVLPFSAFNTSNTHKTIRHGHYISSMNASPDQQLQLKQSQCIYICRTYICSFWGKRRN